MPQEKPNVPEQPASDEIQKKRQELLKWQKDNTGVWKGQYFGRELKQMLENRGLEDGSDGRIEKTAEDASTHFLLVNMGELDRLNASGDHAIGDSALKATADMISDRIKKIAPEAKADIYRTAGNDFSIRLENTSLSSARMLSIALTGKVDLSGINQEAAPIIASLMSRSDLVDVLNGLEDGDRKSFMDEEDKSGESINIVKEMLQQQNDIQKIEMRFHRMEEMMQRGDEVAEPFYKEFQAKIMSAVFGTKELLYQDFVKRFKQLDREGIHRLALQDARRQFDDRRGQASGLERVLVDEAAKQALSGIEKTEKVEGSKVPAEAQQEATFLPPEDTRGKRLIQQKEADYASANTEEAYLDLEIEKAKRDPMTGLAERGSMFADMSKGLENKEAMSLVFIDMAFLKYFDKEGGRETGNVAIKKAAEMLDKLSIQASEQGIKVEPYRIGGDEFALGVLGASPAQLIEVQNLLRKAQAEAAPIPLQGKEAAGTFYKQKLFFNYGAFGPKTFEEAKAYIKEKGISLNVEDGSEDEREQVVEFALKLADKQLEIQKGTNRIKVLVEELRNAKASGDSGKFDQLLKYSQKGIFGTDGEALIRELAEKPTNGNDERILTFVVNAIRAKAEKRKGYESSLDKIIDERVKELYFDQQLEGMREIISSLQAELAESKAENAALKQQIETLKAEISTISGLREKIVKA